MREYVDTDNAVINEHLLFPYKYAAPTARPGSSSCQRLTDEEAAVLFHARGPGHQEGLFELDDDLATEEYHHLREGSRN
ncbi:hypothetical protein [Streptomyces iconiensis]|uniref:Uncharacterized protein n=1 Tax=Streptomyces iconiensis TaxID=1384038 RepID=A0ABT7A6R2_9ACTN|nr:hypothetical protein [Streptomyces iconiensis]MDJ1137030.1 hypothetical protein [Streptomyces iconiensis]